MSTENMLDKRIAIIGAGPMGLAVAYQLIKEGYQPVIYEADDRIGGMTAGFDFNGLWIERYYHFHCTSDNALLEILNELNLQNKMHWVPTKMGYFYQQKIHPWGNPLALLKFPGLDWLAKLRYGLHVFCCTKRKNWQPLDKLEATSWIKRWIGNEAYEILWSKLFNYKFYDYTHKLSAAWIWSRIQRIGRSRYNIFQEKLGYLEDGSDTLLQAMKNYIEAHGGVFHLRQAVNKVIIADGRVQGIQTNTGIEKFSTVISTAPLSYVPKIFPDLPQTILLAYQSIKNIAVVCVIVKLKRALSENFWLNVNDPDMDIPGLVEYTNLRPLAQHIVYIPFYMPGEHPKFQEADEVFLTKVKHYLKIINPELTDDDFIDIRASRYRYAQPICEPGHLQKLPPAKLPIKNLWIADTSYYYPEDRGISESIKFGRNLAKQTVL